MTKSELIEVIAQRARITKGRAELVVNAVFESMAHSLEVGQGIEIRGFGSFTIREYGSYTGRNPQTNSPVEVRPKKLPFFKVGKDLRDLVNARAGTALPVDTDGPDEDSDAGDGVDEPSVETDEDADPDA